MKTLVVYFSRTGTTKKIAEAIAEKFSADVEEIKDTVSRSGVKGYLKSGRDAMKKKLTKLEPLRSKLDDYDLVIIGTPIWGWNMSVPVRTFLSGQKNNFKKTAFFCTMGGSGDKRAFLDMEDIIKKTPSATLALTTKDVVSDNYNRALDKFINEVK